MSGCSKLGLGTVQWGMPYGIANRSGQPAATDVHGMLRLARERGVRLLDTAYAYGEAEKALGEQGVTPQGFQVVTKTKPIQSQDISEQEVAAVSVAFIESLVRLHCTRVYGLLVHHANTLLARGGDRLWVALQELKTRGQVEYVGVSVYHPQQLENILDRYQIDLVQLPFNIYDQRFAQAGLLKRLMHERIEVHARSAFLQGVLLLPPDQLPSHFSPIREHQARLHQQFSAAGLTPLEGCLRYCLGQNDIDKVIVGCESIDQLKEIMIAAERAGIESSLSGSFLIDDECLINPSRWPRA